MLSAPDDACYSTDHQAARPDMTFSVYAIRLVNSGVYDRGPAPAIPGGKAKEGLIYYLDQLGDHLRFPSYGW